MLAVTGRVSEEFSSRIWHSSRHSKPKHQNWVSQVPLLAPGKARTSIAKAFFVMLSGAKRSRNICSCPSQAFQPQSCTLPSSRHRPTMTKVPVMLSAAKRSRNICSCLRELSTNMLNSVGDYSIRILIYEWKTDAVIDNHSSRNERQNLQA